MLAARTTLACKWVETLPVPQVGTSLDDSAFGIAICLRLGIPPCTLERCARCTKEVDNSTHGLRCRRCFGRIPRHSSINEEIKKALCSAHVPATREPLGLFSNQLRPDGVTLVPWRLGRYACWDVTVVDTLARSYLAATPTTEGMAASRAEGLKINKYVNLPTSYEFFPLAFETLGSMGEATKAFIQELCRRIRESTGDPRAPSQFLQRLSLEIVRGNACSIMGAMLPEAEYRNWPPDI